MKPVGTILRVTCVLLFLGLIYLWGRGSAGQDQIGWSWVGPNREMTLRRVTSGRGSVGLFLLDAGPGAAYGGDGYSFTYTPASRSGTSVPEESLLGFRFHQQTQTDARGVSSRWTFAMVPYALLAALAALPPALRARRWVRANRRLASGRCRSCGYDLRGLPHLCPECGDRIFPAPPDATKAR